MADNKKYYYLKLKENFFESDEAIILESMPDGYIYSNILLKLYLRSLKNDGLLMFNNLIPYNAQMLATITRHQVGTVEKAIQIFQQLKLIEILDNGAIYMSNIQNFVGKSSTNADRMRLQRAKQKESVQMLNKCAPEIEIEKEIELEKKKEEEDSSASSSSNSQNLKYFFDKWQEITGRALTPFEIEDIPKLHKEDNFSIDLMLTALKEAANSTSNFNFNYFKSILMRYKRQGLLTPEMVAGAEKQRQEAKDKQYSKQQAKSNVPEWVDEEYKHEATVDEQAQLDALKAAMMED
ncbi:Helicase loader DnaB [Streptococcus infantarius subsp. infantarius]|nr:Helicase loader DnaB [Streptococcus infantarius subsp. infantarius]